VIQAEAAIATIPTLSSRPKRSDSDHPNPVIPTQAKR